MVEVTSGECKETLGKQIKLELCGFEIPNIFTPNEDGQNDYFTIHDPLGSGIQCEIYNRWGKLVFKNESIEIKWDGTEKSSGAKAPSGTYFYIIIVKSVSNEPFKGTLVLWR